MVLVLIFETVKVNLKAACYSLREVKRQYKPHPRRGFKVKQNETADFFVEVQECDATMRNSSNSVGLKKK